VVLSFNASTTSTARLNVSAGVMMLFRGGSANMILFSSVGHGLIEAIRQGFPIRVGALADRVRPPLLAGEGRGQLCLAVRSEPVGAWSGGRGVRLVRQAIPVQ
jgi:hypothetical protein